MLNERSVLSPQCQSLFPAAVAAAELRGRVDGLAALLPAAEAACIARAVPARADEFAAGRLCARRALAELGVVDVALPMATDRQAVWPDEHCGSITHTAEFCAAVAAERRHYRGLGLDSEVVGRVKPELWARICRPEEAAWVRALGPASQAAAVTLIFAVKEAFYKCQFAVVGERLGFHDVRVDLSPALLVSGSFVAHPARPILLALASPPPWAGRYRFHEQYVSAGMALPAAPCTAARPAADQ
jgi:4'-phosphopantetheinyl transferase EntD